MRQNCRISMGIYALTAGPAFPESQRERPPDGRSAHGTESRKRSSGQPCGRTSTEDGSPPCSPQMPSLMSGRVCLPQLNGHLHELADAVLVETGERIGLVDLLVVVGAEELAGVVAAEAEGHLGQVVGAEGEELGLLGDLVGGQQPRAGSRSWCRPCTSSSTPCSSMTFLAVSSNDLLDVGQLLDLADQRDHDFRMDVVAILLLDLDGRLDDRTGLHLGDFRIASPPDGSRGGPSSG